MSKVIFISDFQNSKFESAKRKLHFSFGCRTEQEFREFLIADYEQTCLDSIEEARYEAAQSYYEEMEDSKGQCQFCGIFISSDSSSYELCDSCLSELSGVSEDAYEEEF